MEHISELSTLSWVIYISSLNLGGVFGFLFTIALFFILFGSLLRTHPSCERTMRFGSLLMKTSGALFGLAFLVGIPAVLIPDRQTIMTIAAIEIGNDTQMLRRVEGLLDTFMPLNEGK